MIGKIVLITGASRGLGLMFSEKFVDAGYSVFAAARQPEKSKPLQRLREKHPDRIFPVRLDVCSDESVRAAYKTVSAASDHLDVVVNNAGIAKQYSASFSDLELTDIGAVYETNVIGVLRVTQAFWSLLKKGTEKKIIQITSLMGSIDDNQSGGAYGYRLSKAALNMLNKNFSLEWGKDGFTSIALHPGWVKTDMGGPNAPLDIQTSVQGMMNVILNATRDQNGAFLDYTGKTLPY
jgi:NAD(P)-dependent dehydrogenase (short-subunit alcohol dehydrogenase family)